MRLGNSSSALGAGAIVVGFCHCAAQRAATQPAPPPADTSAPSATSSEPQWEPVETGKDCASAQAKCGGGVCDAKVKNDCDTAVRCALEIAATCGTSGGGSTANGSDHATIAAHATGDVGAQATCGGDVVHTEIQKLSCR
jgi:hypothetical protein